VSDDDLFYYRQRAETEFERAKRSSLPEVVAAHHRLAEAYLGRIAAFEPAKQIQHA